MKGKSLRSILVCLALSSPFCHPVTAKNLGVYGPIFPVIEDDLLAIIENHFEELEANGGMDALEDEMKTKTKAYVRRPRPAGHFPYVDEYRRFAVDLSIVVQTDLSDQNGKVFARAGDRFNPLDYSRFNKRIFVIDGDDERQVDLALLEGDELDTLIVLVKGAPLELTAKYGRRFWFDQQGQLTKRFDIQRVPSIISRHYPNMWVEEIPVGG